MQRTAVAAPLMNPRVLLADEPTGNLDADTGGEIVRLLRDINRDEGVTIVMVTHNLDIVSATDRRPHGQWRRDRGLLLPQDLSGPPAAADRGVILCLTVRIREMCAYISQVLVRYRVAILCVRFDCGIGP